MATGQLRKNRRYNLSISRYLSAVNQKLLFSDHLLKLADGDDLMLNNKHLAVAIAQSVTLQLYQAWGWHIKDVASHYKLNDPSIIADVDILVKALADEGKTPAESQELQNLLMQEGSWVVALFNAHSQLYALPEITKAQMDSDRLPLRIIGGASNNAGEVFEWSLVDVSNWKLYMQELVDRQRDMMIEF
jgi:hypothetical protein